MSNFADNAEKSVHRIVCLVTSISLVAVSSCAQNKTNALTGGGTVLNLEQAVVVINELTPLQINLECTEWMPRERVSLPGTRANPGGFTNVTDQSVHTWFAKVENYTLIGTNGVYTLLPKELPANRSRHLDYIVPRYQTHYTNLFSALFALCKIVPFELDITEPVVTTRNNQPDLSTGYPHWELSEMPFVEATLTNRTVRDILTELINSQQSGKKSYWIARPLHEPAAKLLGTNASSVVTLNIRHAKESRHSFILRQQ